MNYALCVGVNHYKIGGNDLRYCVNDVYGMTRLLTQQFGFSVLHVKTLTDQNATMGNILDRLSYMVTHAEEGDHLVFHFSGHGSQVPDTEGDEPDGLDEVLCPYDFSWSGKYVRDDDLHQILSQLHPGASMDVILDCCHSGTGLREIGDPTPKFIQYPGPEPFDVPVLNINKMLGDHNFPNVALWAGCRSDQTSSDGGFGIENGAMTWAFIKNAPFGLDRHHINRGIAMDLEAKGYDQEPQLECCTEMRNRTLFK